jgi:hypothetical protein
MILVQRMRELAQQQLSDAQGELSGGWSAEQTRSFQNTPYRPSLVPLLVDGTAVAALTPVVQAYVRALERTLRRYLTDAAMRSWFGCAGWTAMSTRAGTATRAGCGCWRTTPTRRPARCSHPG